MWRVIGLRMKRRIKPDSLDRVAKEAKLLRSELILSPGKLPVMRLTFKRPKKAACK
jgi:hypothetical protein